MMADLDAQRVAGASVPLTMADGTEYLMSPLSDKDINELDGWIQQRFMETVYRTAPPSGPDRDKHITLGMQAAYSMSFMSGLGMKSLTTVEGLARLLWQSTRGNHPDLTFEKLRKDLLEPKNIEKLRQVFGVLNLPKNSTAQSANPGPKQKRDKRKRKR